jgi:hypothetical protein
MRKEKIPLFVARKATKKDLKRLNEIRFAKDDEIQEKDLDKIIVLEINGKVRGMHSYNPTKQTFSEATSTPIISEFVAGLAKSEINMEKENKEFEKLIKKYGSARLAKMYEEKLEKLIKKSKK